MSKLYVLEIPHQRDAVAYQIDEKKLISHVANAPEYADAIPQHGFKEDTLTLEQAREVMMSDLHSVKFLKMKMKFLNLLKITMVIKIFDAKMLWKIYFKETNE